MFTYSQKEFRTLTKLLPEVREPDRGMLPMSIRRNTSGTEIRLDFDAYVIVLNKTGATAVLEKPGVVAWIEDNDKFVAWSSGDDELHFAGGEALKHPCALAAKFDTSGRYFSLTSADEMTSEIRRSSKPRDTLAVVNSPDVAIADRGKELTVAYNEASDIRDIILCHYLEEPGGLKLSSTTRIKRPWGKFSPFCITDVDTRAGVFFIVNVVDMPFAFRSRIFKYTIATSELQSLNRASYLSILLAEDIVNLAILSIQKAPDSSRRP